MDEVRFNLRMPPELHAEMVEWSKDEERSLNGQILRVLKQALEERAKRKSAQEDKPQPPIN